MCNNNYTYTQYEYIYEQHENIVKQKVDIQFHNSH